MPIYFKLCRINPLPLGVNEEEEKEEECCVWPIFVAKKIAKNDRKK
jgi:hypothetical protein